MLVVALAAYPTLLVPALQPVAAWLGAGVALAVGVALVTERHGLIGWAVAALAALYITALQLGGAGMDPAAPLVGAGLLALAELAYGARRRHLDHAGLPPTTGRTPAIVAAGATALASTLLLIAEPIAPPWSLGLHAAGLVAVIALLASLARLSRR